MSGGYRNPEEFGELTAAELLWVQTGAAGVLLLAEQSSAPSATANYGKVYVKSSDSLLYFKDDSGNEYSLTSGITVSTPTGTVNGVNATFNVGTVAPKWVVADGITYFSGAGYTYASPNVTMDIPPSSYIRAII